MGCFVVEPVVIGKRVVVEGDFFGFSVKVQIDVETARFGHALVLARSCANHKGGHVIGSTTSDVGCGHGPILIGIGNAVVFVK